MSDGKRWWWKAFKILFAGLLLLFVLCVLGWFIVDGLFARQLAEKMQPVEKEIQQKLVAQREETAAPPVGPTAVSVLDELTSGPNRITFPLDPRAAKDGEELIIRALRNPDGLTAEERALLLARFDMNAPFLAILRRLAECGAWRRSPVDLAHPWLIPEPRFAGFVREYKRLFAEANVLAVEGRMGEAGELWRLGVRSGNVFLNQSESVMGYIIGLVLRNTGATALQPMLRGRNMDEVMLEAMIGDLDPNGLRRQWLGVLERRRTSNLLTRREGINGHPELLIVLNDERPWIRRGQVVALRLLRPVLRRDLVLWGEESAAQLRLLNSAQPWQWCEQLSSNTSGQPLPRWRVLTRELTNQFENMTTRCEQVFNTEAESQVARLALACRVFQKRHGRWPESLAALTPDCLPSLPTDPYTGNGFQYNLQPDGLKIFSTGRQGPKEDDRDGSDNIVWQESWPPAAKP